MLKPSLDSAFKDKSITHVAFLITVALAALYHTGVGVAAVWPDTFLYGEAARNLLAYGKLVFTTQTPTTYLPFYSLVMGLAFSVPDFLLANQMLVWAQCILICSTLYPLQKMLLKNTALTGLQAATLAIVSVLGATSLTYVTLLSEDALFISLFVWFAYFYDCVLENEKKSDGLISAILLGVLLLTKEIGWVVYAAVLLNTLFAAIQKKTFSRNFAALVIVPLCFAGFWQLYLTLGLNIPFEFHNWNLNNALARFNFVKNGIFYLLYAGMPLAGIGFIMLCFTKQEGAWRNSFFRFSFLVLIGILFYNAFATPVIVERKLDYIANRLLEPFVILPLIALFRMPFETRKAIATNSVLVFLCLMIFDYPYILKFDFNSGLSYWAQSLDNINLGKLRNFIYLVLVCIPIALLWLKPKMFIWAYVFIAAIIGFGNIAKNDQIWSMNDDSNLKFVNIHAFSQSKDIQDAKAIYADTRCYADTSSDIGQLYNCHDIGRFFYFVPRQIQAKTLAQLRDMTLEKDEYVLFASSKNDNAVGPTVAEIGLGKLMRVTQENISALQNTPLVMLTAFEKMGRYINIGIGGVMERATLFAPQAVMHIESDRKGCTEIHMLLASDGNTKSEAGKQVDFFLNDKLIKKINLKTITGEQLPTKTIIPLNLNEGDNIFQLRYIIDDAESTVKANVFMFKRPQFYPCGVK